MIKPNGLNPFKRFCITIGEIPTSYMESMTYYEMLEWFCKYLEKTVIPAINNNAEAITELQNLYIELKNYVDNYFTNLDVQEEINNKLDDMASSGQLAEIIALYLQIASVLSFDTIEDMSTSQNIVEDSTCYVLGELSFNDGKGGFYKVRAISEGDVIDDYNLVALTDDTLVAERIDNTVHSNNLLKDKRFIFIGDSYVTGTLNGTPEATDGWAKRIKDSLGLSNDNCYIYGEGASGFVATGHDGNRFYDLLNNNLSNISDKDSIDYIVVCGGINDNSSSISNIESRISAFSTLVQNNFPNAKLFIGCISTSSLVSSTGTNARKLINHVSLPAYKNCIKYKAYYLNGVENIIKDYSLMGTDYIHPSEDGYTMLCNGIIQTLETGKFEMDTDVKGETIEATDRTIADNHLNIYTKITNNILMINIDGYVTFNTNVPFNTDTNISLFTINSDLIRKNFTTDLLLSGAVITVGSSGLYCNGYLFINDDNELIIHFKDYPEGVTQGTRINIKSNNLFCIDD